MFSLADRQEPRSLASAILSLKKFYSSVTNLPVSPLRLSKPSPTQSALRTDKEIFLEALDLPENHGRAAFLDRVCAGDPEKRKRLEQLLASHFQADVFMEAPAVEESRASAGYSAELVGTMIGRYKLLELIGEGGFGSVYLAEQGAPVRRKVALKVIKLGMDTRQVVARFAAEQQALALMEHPNIAKVLDAGATESGRPYFVMELVRGERITD